MGRYKRKRASKKRTRANHEIATEWAALFKAHNAQVTRYISGRTRQDDDIDSVILGDIVAKTYLHSLRDAVPGIRQEKWPFVPLHAEQLLFDHVATLNSYVCELARCGRWHACEAIWKEALRLATTFSEVALANPDPFKGLARNALFMPSLRVPPRRIRPKKRLGEKWLDPFVGDSGRLAEAIELSANTIGAKISDNRSRIGSLCALLVAECLQEVKRARYLWSNLFTPYKKPVPWPTLDQIRPYQAMTTVDKVMADMKDEPSRKPRGMKEHLRFFCLLDGAGAKRLHFLTLNELSKEEAPNWWKGAVERMIEQRFPGLLNDPIWQRELKRVSSGTPADMRKELKDYCRDKVKQFA